MNKSIKNKSKISTKHTKSQLKNKQKQIKIKCWVAFCEENNEFNVYFTREKARAGAEEMKGFDLEMIVKKGELIIYK